MRTKTKIKTSIQLCLKAERGKDKLRKRKSQRMKGKTDSLTGRKGNI